jgi:hypothetical protein
VRRLTLSLTLLGSIVWAYNFYSGLTTAARLRDVGVSQFSMVVLPFLMPLVGLALSAFFTTWLLKRGRLALAAGLGGFSLLAGLLVAWITGAASAG